MATQTLFDRVWSQHISRRNMLGIMAGTAAATVLPGCIRPSATLSDGTQIVADHSAFTPFSAVTSSSGDDVTIPGGFDYHVVCSWGDALFTHDDSPFDYARITPEQQRQRVGFNNDYTAIFAFKHTKNKALLVMNHEYPDAKMMFPSERLKQEPDVCTAVEMESVGITVAEIARDNSDSHWNIVTDSRYNRRITAANTVFKVTGPAAGHQRLTTEFDPTGTRVIGTFGNCAGGVTPWKSYLTAEENIDDRFYLPKDMPDTEGDVEKLRRFGLSHQPKSRWDKVDQRFHAEHHPNEPHRFGWICEIYPDNPRSTPLKRTALGRFKHEGATCVLAADKRLVVYMGDDEVFQHIYKYVSTKVYIPGDTEHNASLLDEGILYCARFDDDGSVHWLPLVYGLYGLDKRAGFHTQADISIDTRRAAAVSGATPMDRPEGIAVDPGTHDVFVSLTNNVKRFFSNPANPGSVNIHGHILVISPEDDDHASTTGTWTIMLSGGDKDAALPGSIPLSNPDNIVSESRGNLWIATDGMEKTTQARDGLFYLSAYSPNAKPRRFLSAPKGAEVTGVSFTPDKKELFLSIQHPGEGSSYDKPSSTWPNIKKNTPPLPSVICIRRKYST